VPSSGGPAVAFARRAVLALGVVSLGWGAGNPGGLSQAVRTWAGHGRVPLDCHLRRMRAGFLASSFRYEVLDSYRDDGVGLINTCKPSVHPVGSMTFSSFPMLWQQGARPPSGSAESSCEAIPDVDTGDSRSSAAQLRRRPERAPRVGLTALSLESSPPAAFDLSAWVDEGAEGGSRLGAGVGTQEGGAGSINIQNSQRKVPLDLDVLHNHMSVIMGLLGREDHDVSILLTNDRNIRDYNERYRGKRKATDILSFPFHQYERPEVPTKESLSMNGGIRDLGDMIVSLEYVKRQCERDEQELKEKGQNDWSGERGASGAMASIFDVQVKGGLDEVLRDVWECSSVLSLGTTSVSGHPRGDPPFGVSVVGLYDAGKCSQGAEQHFVLDGRGRYDHETEEDYSLMVAKEEAVIAEFQKLVSKPQQS
jgi:rRNA maturation RNase YbeY